MGDGVTANMTLTGSIVADAVLGCGRFCGLRGTCVPNDGIVANAGAVVCQCDCGWGGADCSVPQGFCDAPVSLLLPGNTSSITDERAAVQCRGAPPLRHGVACPWTRTSLSRLCHAF